MILYRKMRKRARKHWSERKSAENKRISVKSANEWNVKRLKTMKMPFSNSGTPSSGKSIKVVQRLRKHRCSRCNCMGTIITQELVKVPKNKRPKPQLTLFHQSPNLHQTRKILISNLLKSIMFQEYRCSRKTAQRTSDLTHLTRRMEKRMTTSSALTLALKMNFPVFAKDLRSMKILSKPSGR